MPGAHLPRHGSSIVLKAIEGEHTSHLPRNEVLSQPAIHQTDQNKQIHHVGFTIGFAGEARHLAAGGEHLLLQDLHSVGRAICLDLGGWPFFLVKSWVKTAWLKQWQNFLKAEEHNCFKCHHFRSCEVGAKSSNKPTALVLFLMVQNACHNIFFGQNMRLNFFSEALRWQIFFLKTRCRLRSWDSPKAMKWWGSQGYLNRLGSAAALELLAVLGVKKKAVEKKLRILMKMQMQWLSWKMKVASRVIRFQIDR